MSATKLYRLLSSFNTGELKRFRLFLSSPFFNQGENMIKLFDHIRKYHPDYSHPKLQKEQLQKVLGKAPPFKQSYVNNRLSQLSLFAEEFLVVQQVRTKKSLHKKILHDALIQHGHYDLFKKSTEKEIAQLKDHPEYDWSYHMNLFELMHELFIHPQTVKWDPKHDESIEMMAYLEEAYLILQLRYGFHQKLRDSIFHSNKVTIFLDRITPLCRDHKNPVIQMYLLLADSFNTSAPEEHWHKTFNFYKKNFNLLPRNEKQIGLISLTNRGRKIALQGKHDFHNSVFEVYRFGFEKDLLIQNGLISEIAFKNIAFTGAATGNIKWTAAFIKKYEKYLPSNYDKNILYLAKAYLAFYNNEFTKCNDWLEKSEHLNTQNTFNYRSLHTRCLYELHAGEKNANQLLIGHLDAYARFLQHKKKELSADTIKAYQNFILLIRKMVEVRQLPPRERKSSIQKIEKEIEKRQINIAIPWIRKKLEELKKL